MLNLPNPHISHKNSTMVGHYFPKFNMENGVVLLVSSYIWIIQQYLLVDYWTLEWSCLTRIPIWIVMYILHSIQTEIISIYICIFFCYSRLYWRGSSRKYYSCISSLMTCQATIVSKHPFYPMKLVIKGLIDLTVTLIYLMQKHIEKIIYRY